MFKIKKILMAINAINFSQHKLQQISIEFIAFSTSFRFQNGLLNFKNICSSRCTGLKLLLLLLLLLLYLYYSLWQKIDNYTTLNSRTNTLYGSSELLSMSNTATEQ